MKTKFMVSAALLAVSSIVSSCGNQESKSEKTTESSAEVKTYTCPMHSEVTSDKPGQCPKCGMDLVEKAK